MGEVESIFPQIAQNIRLDFKFSSEFKMLGINFSLFFKRCKTILLADLGPKLGSFENKSINSPKEEDMPN